jgi:hypothetical protein
MRRLLSELDSDRAAAGATAAAVAAATFGGVREGTNASEVAAGEVEAAATTAARWRERKLDTLEALQVRCMFCVVMQYAVL